MCTPENLPCRVIAKTGFLHYPERSRFGKCSYVLSPKTMSAAFLDRDGLLIRENDFLLYQEDIEFLDKVICTLKEIQSLFFVVIVTNQSAIARGLLTESELLAIHNNVVLEIEERGGVIDAIYYCPHLPGSSLEKYDKICPCRKPKPGMIHHAIGQCGLDRRLSFMIGDSERDVEAARNAGIVGIRTMKNRVPEEGNHSNIEGLFEAFKGFIENPDTQSEIHEYMKGH